MVGRKLSLSMVGKAGLSQALLRELLVLGVRLEDGGREVTSSEI